MGTVKRISQGLQGNQPSLQNQMESGQMCNELNIESEKYM